MNASNVQKTIGEYLLISLAALLTAIAVNFFYSEYSLAPGGITGMAIIVTAITKIPIQYVTLGISGPLLILATVFIGKTFGLKTLYITLLTPVCMKLIPSLHVVDHVITAGILGGLCVGAAVGIAIISGCATGGTDTIAMLLNKIFKKAELSTILLLLDGTVVILSGLIAKNMLIAVLSFGSLVVIIYTIKFITHRFPRNE